MVERKPDGPPQLATFLRAHPQKRGTAWWGLPLFPLIDGRLASAQQLERAIEADVRARDRERLRGGGHRVVAEVEQRAAIRRHPRR